MEPACLVTGKSNELLAEVVLAAAARSRRVLVARSGPLELRGVGEEIKSVSWNRRSALSARTTTLHARNLFGRLDEAIIVFAPVVESAPFHESSIVGIENRTDAEVKGYLFLLRELVAHFQAQGGGKLLLAVQDHDVEVRSPLEAMSLGSFVAAAEALQRSYINEPLAITLCYSTIDEPAGYASFCLDALDAPPPRRPKVEWQRYSRRGGLRSLGR